MEKGKLYGKPLGEKNKGYRNRHMILKYTWRQRVQGRENDQEEK